ncbi:MAG TPA: hypothetical protein VKX45_23440 [Bryobacteraceae bacterium]|jgi:hypothetical protein|nr:hypothetical protein [Bryobacteraceae bacterium]
MLSTRLVQLIESHWEEIADRMVKAVKNHPEMASFAQRPPLEIREWCREILQNLGYLLSATQDDELQRNFETLGKLRFEQNIPLHEAVLRIHLLKRKLFSFIGEQGYPMNTMQLYAEEELEHRLGWLFDACVYHVVRGYEKALRLEQKLMSWPA